MYQILFILLINWFSPAEEIIPEQDVSFMTEVEQGTWKEVNEYRKSKGLPVLPADKELTELCREHSRNLAAGTAREHDGFKGRIEQAQQMFNLRSISENVLYLGGIPLEKIPEVATEEWAQSPSHQKAMVGNWTKTGMGIAIGEDGTYYFTQLFIRE